MNRPLWPAGDLPAPTIETDGRAIVLDLGPGGRIMGEDITGVDTARLSNLIDCAMEDAGTGFAFGRYAEPREVYRGDLFTSNETGERRTIHMGIDVFCDTGTSVHAPLDGMVEVATNNTAELDYGPVVILRHTALDGKPFFTLYGHLTAETLGNIEVGQRVAAGELIARVGSPPDNGNWPPHLHLQLILDLMGLGGDFPGVAFNSRKAYWLSLSPSPAGFFAGYEPHTLEY